MKTGSSTSGRAGMSMICSAVRRWISVLKNDLGHIHRLFHNLRPRPVFSMPVSYSGVPSACVRGGNQGIGTTGSAQWGASGDGSTTITRKKKPATLALLCRCERPHMGCSPIVLSCSRPDCLRPGARGCTCQLVLQSPACVPRGRVRTSRERPHCVNGT